MEDGDFGYSSASIEANGYANDAWASGDSAGYDYWSSQATDAWNTSVDVYVGGRDAVGLRQLVLVLRRLLVAPSHDPAPPAL